MADQQHAATLRIMDLGRGGTVGGMSRRITVTLDDPTDATLARHVQPTGDQSAWIRAAIAEKAARDEHRDELAELRAELERVKRHVGMEP